MLHGNATPQLPANDVIASRIAQLSAEYIEADRDRRSAISAELRALVDGTVTPLHRRF